MATKTQYDVFVSHASEDKDYVDSLVHALKQANITVWLDALVLEWGDDLRGSIDRGLLACKFGIVVFSPNFLKRKKWTEYELNSLFSKEVAGQKVILPIWHKVSREDLVGYSPAFADRIAKQSSSDTVEEIADCLLGLLGRETKFDSYSYTGRRNRARLTSSLNHRTLPQEILSLSERGRGRIERSSGLPSRYAALVELLLAGKIIAEEGRVKIADRRPCADAYLDFILVYLLELSRKHGDYISPHHLYSIDYHNSGFRIDVDRVLIDQMKANKELVEAESQSFLFWTKREYYISDVKRVSLKRLELLNAVTNQKQLSDRNRMLLGIVRASHSFRYLITGRFDGQLLRGLVQQLDDYAGVFPDPLTDFMYTEPDFGPTIGPDDVAGG